MAFVSRSERDPSVPAPRGTTDKVCSGLDVGVMHRDCMCADMLLHEWQIWCQATLVHATTTPCCRLGLEAILCYQHASSLSQRHRLHPTPNVSLEPAVAAAAAAMDTWSKPKAAPHHRQQQAALNSQVSLPAVHAHKACRILIAAPRAVPLQAAPSASPPARRR
jgi:hypothetical protein